MAVLTPQPKMQFTNAAGVPLSGGKVYTYVAGTTTPQATYTDVTGATPNPNPVILDSRGEAAMWLGGANYKFKLTDANDVEIWTVDYISAPTSAVSPVLSGNVTIDSDTPTPALKITQTGTGAVLRVQDSADPDTTPFIIDGSGNVGLGTPTPSAQLEATGAVKLGSLSLTSAPLPIASGGTNATSASAARTSLGVAIGTDVIGWVAPGTSGNVLLSDGTNWTSSPRSVPAIVAADAGKSLINNGTISSWGSSIVSGTAVTVTGTPSTVEFTGIPSWAKRVSLILSELSINGTNDCFFQFGNGSFVTSGYVSYGARTTGAGLDGVNGTAGIILNMSAATETVNGIFTAANVSGNTWSGSYTFGSSTLTGFFGAGGITLGGVLDRIRIITSGGNTFDTGVVNVFWE